MTPPTQAGDQGRLKDPQPDDKAFAAPAHPGLYFRAKDAMKLGEDYLTRVGKGGGTSAW